MEISKPKASPQEIGPHLKRQRRDSILEIEKRKAETEAKKRKALQQEELEQL